MVKLFYNNWIYNEIYNGLSKIDKGSITDIKYGKVQDTSLVSDCKITFFEKEDLLGSIVKGKLEIDGKTIYFLEQKSEYKKICEYKVCAFKNKEGKVFGIDDKKYIILQREGKIDKETTDMEYLLNNFTISDKFADENISNELGIKSFLKHFAYTYYITKHRKHLENLENTDVRDDLEYFCQVEKGGKKYTIVHTALQKKNSEYVYAILTNEENNNLVDIKTGSEIIKSGYVICDNKGKTINITNKNLPRILRPFTELSHIVFNEKNLCKIKSLLNEHALFDHIERKKKLFEAFPDLDFRKDEDKDKKNKYKEKLEELVRVSIEKAKNDPLYMRPYIYVKTTLGGGTMLDRCFLLPLEYDLFAVIRQRRIGDLIKALQLKKGQLYEYQKTFLQCEEQVLIDSYTIPTILNKDIVIEANKHLFPHSNIWNLNTL